MRIQRLVSWSLCKTYSEVIVDCMADDDPVLHDCSSLTLDVLEWLSTLIRHVLGSDSRKFGPVIRNLLLLSHKFVHENVAMLIDDANPAVNNP